MRAMTFDGARARPGTTRAIHTIADVEVGQTVVCQKAGVAGGPGSEYTISALRPSVVELECRGKKCTVKPSEFVLSFERRVGPILPESIRRGLKARATVTDKKYNAGDIITLTETGGTVYDFRNENNKRGAVEREALLTAFIYV